MSALGAAAPYLHHPADSHSGRVSFLGPQPSPEVRAVAQLLKDLDRSTFRKLLKLVVGALHGKDCREAVQQLGASANLSEERLAVLLAGTHTLLQQALRLPPASLRACCLPGRAPGTWHSSGSNWRFGQFGIWESTPSSRLCSPTAGILAASRVLLPVAGGRGHLNQRSVPLPATECSHAVEAHRWICTPLRGAHSQIPGAAVQCSLGP